MNPDDFLDLAIRLSNCHSEAERRTAVSRAYYGLFHLAHRLVSRCGISLPINEAHSKLCHCLTSGSANVDAQAAGSKLNTLRESRRQADYDLDAAECNNPRWVQFPIGLAKQIADALSACSQEPGFGQMRTEIREYARAVRLSVREP